MIAVDEIQPAVPQAIKPEGTVEVAEVLTLEEEAAVEYIDAELEPHAAELSGDMLSVPVPLSIGNLKVLHALKKRWEAGGWIVGVLPMQEQGEVVAHQFILAKPRNGVVTAKRVQTALEKRDDNEYLSVTTFHDVQANLKAPKLRQPLLVRMPTRGRPEQALSVLEKYRTLAADPVAIEVVLDEDDDSMVNAVVLERLVSLGCTVAIGRHRSKIEAVNGGRVDDWEVLALASDDMVPAVHGYDRRILAAMREHFPLLDGAVHFHDGYNRDHVRPGQPILCTMPIMGRHLYEQFGYVYYPEYGSLYSDDEQTRVLTKMKRLVFIDEMLIEHRHHAAGKAPNDALYQHNDGKWGAADRALFERRSAANFDMPEMVLSILICSTEKRAPFLRRLHDHLRNQVRKHPRRVEIVVSIDRGEHSIGEKRNFLLQQAVGEYVAFVDDDDWVAHDYVDRVLRALEGRPDCLSLVGVMTTDGERPERFEHSLKYERWETLPGLHVRTPNHLNVVKRELALKVGFPPVDHGEDHDFSKRLRPLLRNESLTGDAPLYYYWCRTNKERG